MREDICCWLSIISGLHWDKSNNCKGIGTFKPFHIGSEPIMRFALGFWRLMVVNILITFWFWRVRGKWAHLGLPEVQCSHTQLEAVCLTGPHTAFEIASHLFLYLQNINHKIPVRFVVSCVTSHTRFCLQTSTAFQAWLLVKRRSCKSWVLLTKWVLPPFQKVNFETIHCKQNLSDLETNVTLRILRQWGLISREDLDASCPRATVKIHFSCYSGMYYQWTLLACNPACEKMSSVSISNPLDFFLIVPSTFRLDHGKQMFAEECLTLLYFYTRTKS